MPPAEERGPSEVSAGDPAAVVHRCLDEVVNGGDLRAWRTADSLSEAECMELLANGGLGRLVFTSRYGPTALPVVYRIDGESIVLARGTPPSLMKTCVLVSRTPTTRSPWRPTRSMRRRARGGSCWRRERRIT